MAKDNEDRINDIIRSCETYGYPNNEADMITIARRLNDPYQVTHKKALAKLDAWGNELVRYKAPYSMIKRVGELTNILKGFMSWVSVKEKINTAI